MKRIYIASAFAFLAGYAANDVIQAMSLNVQPAHAEVAGMNWYDLKLDFDFEKAVLEVIEDEKAEFKRIIKNTIEDIVEDCVSQGVDEYLDC